LGGIIGWGPTSFQTGRFLIKEGYPKEARLEKRFGTFSNFFPGTKARVEEGNSLT